MENAGVIKFVLILTSVVALGLTGLREVTKETAELNEAIFNKRAVLKAVEPKLDTEVDDMSDDDVLQVFEKQVEQITLDMSGKELKEGDEAYQLAEKVDMKKEKKKPEAERVLPLFIYEKDGKPNYIMSVRGSGLWDDIWGNIAIDSDINTIVGAAFDHQGETPGLGAEIKDNPSFPSQFAGKKLYNDGVYTSVYVRKGGARDKRFEVDGISGATVTADGVSEMLYRGLKYYEPYLEKLKSDGAGK